MDSLWKSLFIIAAFTCAVNCQNTPTITEEIRKDVRQTGETGVLLCKVKIPSSGVEGLSVSWSKPSDTGDMVISKNGKIVLAFVPENNGLRKYAINLKTVGEITEYQLTVRTLQVNDGGQYWCRASWRGDVVGVFKVGLLEVQIPPEILSSSTNSLMVNQYETVVIKCMAKGMPEPRITWTKGSNNQLPTNHRIEKSVADGLVTSKLTLSNVTTADQGLYRCAANNDFRRAEHTMQLSVSFACEAWYPKENFQAVLNGDGIVECYAKGVPDPTVKWYYWGTNRNSVPTELRKWESQTRLTEGAKYNLIVAHNQNVMHKGQVVKAEFFKLKILTVDANDIGYYGCLAENSLGKSAAVVLLYQTDCTGVNCGSGGNSAKEIVDAAIGNNRGTGLVYTPMVFVATTGMLILSVMLGQ